MPSFLTQPKQCDSQRGHCVMNCGSMSVTINVSNPSLDTITTNQLIKAYPQEKPAHNLPNISYTWRREESLSHSPKEWCKQTNIAHPTGSLWQQSHFLSRWWSRLLKRHLLWLEGVFEGDTPTATPQQQLFVSDWLRHGDREGEATRGHSVEDRCLAGRNGIDLNS